MTIKQACKQFIDSLDETQLTSEDLFFILKIAAEDKGYQMKAEQRGINGTYIHFVKCQD